MWKCKNALEKLKIYPSREIWLAEARRVFKHKLIQKSGITPLFSSLSWPPGVMDNPVKKEEFLKRNFVQGHVCDPQEGKMIKETTSSKQTTSEELNRI
jgi:hypothetical protein